MFLVEIESTRISEYILQIQLTCSTLLHLLRRDREYREYLGHDFHENFRHLLGRRNPSMNPKAFEEELNTLEEVDEHIVARPHILCCL